MGCNITLNGQVPQGPEPFSCIQKFNEFIKVIEEPINAVDIHHFDVGVLQGTQGWSIYLSMYSPRLEEEVFREELGRLLGQHFYVHSNEPVMYLQAVVSFSIYPLLHLMECTKLPDLFQMYHKHTCEKLIKAYTKYMERTHG